MPLFYCFVLLFGLCIYNVIYMLIFCIFAICSFMLGSCLWRLFTGNLENMYRFDLSPRFMVNKISVFFTAVAYGTVNQSIFLDSTSFPHSDKNHPHNLRVSKTTKFTATLIPLQRGCASSPIHKSQRFKESPQIKT